jgi:hypothetical protein
VVRRLRAEGKAEDCGVVFAREAQGREAGEASAYFRVIGLPFQISKNEIVEKLVEPIRYNIKNYGLSLVFEHGKFSGKAVLKVPQEFGEMILAKDRMFIGKRYVEIVPIHHQEYVSYKVREEKQREDTRNQRDPLAARPDRRRKGTSSSGSPSYERSRSREIQSLLREAAIKVRGLPFALNNWDI